jgi:hypothetical protein
MQTKYSTGKMWLFSLVALTVIFSYLVACSPQDTVAPAPTAEVLQMVLVQEPVQNLAPVELEDISYIGGGDCSADRATGDLYIKPDWYCLTIEGKGSAPIPLAVWTKIVRKVREHLTPTITVTNFPTATSTASATATEPNNPTATITGTPSPEPTQKTPEVTATNEPTETATPKPTKTPKPEITGTPCPTETPKDCHANSGRGNGSEDCDGDGDDDDPGNSGGHNNGGD